MNAKMLRKSIVISFFGLSMGLFLCVKKKRQRRLLFGPPKTLLRSSLALQFQTTIINIHASNICLCTGPTQLLGFAFVFVIYSQDTSTNTYCALKCNVIIIYCSARIVTDFLIKLVIVVIVITMCFLQGDNVGVRDMFLILIKHCKTCICWLTRRLLWLCYNLSLIRVFFVSSLFLHIALWYNLALLVATLIMDDAGLVIFCIIHRYNDK